MTVITPAIGCVTTAYSDGHTRLCDSCRNIPVESIVSILQPVPPVYSSTVHWLVNVLSSCILFVFNYR